MPRLKHSVTGVTVSTSDETAKLLGSEWISADSAPRSESPDSTWKVADLKAHASENGIDLGDATKKDEILAAITAASGSGSGE